jgi:hypothetical protein
LTVWLQELVVRLPGGRKVTVDLANPAKRHSKDVDATKRSRPVASQFQGIDPELLVGSGVVVVKDEPGADMDAGDDDGFTVVVSKKSVRREQRELERRRKEEEDEQAQRQRDTERVLHKTDAAVKPKEVRLKTPSMACAVTKATPSRTATPGPAAAAAAPAAADQQQAADAGAGTPTAADEALTPSVPTENAWAHGAPRIAPDSPIMSPSPVVDSVNSVLESDDEGDDAEDDAMIPQVWLWVMSASASASGAGRARGRLTLPGQRL